MPCSSPPTSRRGIHVDDVDVVVHFDPGRAQGVRAPIRAHGSRGREGIVATFVLWDQELEVERLKKRLGLRVPIVEVFSNDERLGDLSSIDGPAPSRRVHSAAS